MRTKIKYILHSKKQEILDQDQTVCGWIKTVRHQKNFSFIEINDGSCFSSLQVIASSDIENYEEILELTTGSSVCFTGKIVQSPGKGQAFEMQATQFKIYGIANATTYPLQKKRHSFEFLRTIAHLRPRTNTQGAVIRIRNAAAFASHEFFQKRDFYYIQTPIITSSDCEGAGEMFRVTTQADSKDLSKDFFGKAAYLTVSGQLNVEAFACSLGDVYTFGPTFRAENSHTPRHLAEFWMIEPEIAFANLNDDIQLIEDYLKYVTKYIYENCREDLEFFDKFIEKGLIERLEKVISTPFARVTYTEAIDLLEKADVQFEFPVSWGCDLQSEHERYLSETYFNKPVFVTDYPKEIKSFYMKLNDDQKTVAAVDLLVPIIGELVGGSAREDDFE
ncbi:MAG TPA: asparagine--tRNA ligase, partial [Chlamydiales bacterium]|nr:asparagine--tRNA ligase [Chlamydiales bacterium]